MKPCNPVFSTNKLYILDTNLSNVELVESLNKKKIKQIANNSQNIKKFWNDIAALSIYEKNEHPNPKYKYPLLYKYNNIISDLIKYLQRILSNNKIKYEISVLFYLILKGKNLYYSVSKSPSLYNFVETICDKQYYLNYDMKLDTYTIK